MTKPKVGVVPLSRATFDLARANVNRRASFALLDRVGLCNHRSPRPGVGRRRSDARGAHAGRGSGLTCFSSCS